MIAYVYLNAIEGPGGITAVVTALLVSLDNYGAMILKGALRLAGALVGGLLSLLVILYVIPEITSLVGATPSWTSAHRWRFAHAQQPLGKPCLIPDEHLAVIGDWCLGAGIGAAWSSADALLNIWMQP